MLTLLDCCDTLQLLNFPVVEQNGPHEALGITHLFSVAMRPEAEDWLRLECRLIGGVSRNKISLWNVIHHNNHFFPYGQFYITPDKSICFGARLPMQLFGHIPADRVVYEMYRAAESHFRLLQSDFTELPFEEAEVKNNLFSLLRGEITAPELPDYPSREEAAFILDELIGQVTDTDTLFRISPYEYTLTGEYLTTITIEPRSKLRQHSQLPNWHLGIRTDVGVLDSTDDRLWVLFNRLNHSTYLLGHYLRYMNRKPLVGLNTELTADFLDHPDLIRKTLRRHQAAARQLTDQLRHPYAIQSVINFNLGL
jgi:hypothetical protein